MTAPVTLAEMIAAVKLAMMRVDLTSEENALAAVLVHLESQQWRDISEAPRDGTEIDVWVVTEQCGEILHGRRYLASYDDIAGGWVDEDDGSLLEWREPEDQHARNSRVTHFMELPSPPSEERPK